MLLSRATYSSACIHFHPFFILVPRGNRTHYPGVASAMLYQLSNMGPGDSARDTTTKKHPSSAITCLIFHHTMLRQSHCSLNQHFSISPLASVWILKNILWANSAHSFMALDKTIHSASVCRSMSHNNRIRI